MAKDRRRFIRASTSIITDSIPLILKGQGEEINFRGEEREKREKIFVSEEEEKADIRYGEAALFYLTTPRLLKEGKFIFDNEEGLEEEGDIVLEMVYWFKEASSIDPPLHSLRIVKIDTRIEKRRRKTEEKKKAEGKLKMKYCPLLLPLLLAIHLNTPACCTLVPACTSQKLPHLNSATPANFLETRQRPKAYSCALLV